MAEGGLQVPGRPSDTKKCNLCLAKNIQQKAVIFCTLCDEAHCKKCFSKHSISSSTSETSDSMSSYQSLPKRKFKDASAKIRKAFRHLGKYSAVGGLISNQFKNNKQANSDVVNYEHSSIESLDNRPEEVIDPIIKNVTDDLDDSECSLSDSLYDKATESSLTDDKLVCRHDVDERSTANRLVDIMQVNNDSGAVTQSSNQMVRKKQFNRSETCNKQTNRNVVSDKPVTGEADTRQDNSQDGKKMCTRVTDDKPVDGDLIGENVIEFDTNGHDLCSKHEKPLERNAVSDKPMTGEVDTRQDNSQDGKKLCTRVAGDKPTDDDLISENVIDFDMNGLDLCSKHEKPLEMFCKSDGMLCCTVCVILDHKNCKSKRIFTIANVAHEMDGNLINHLKNCSDVTMGVIDSLSKVETQLLSDVKLLPGKLETIKKRTFDTFEESIMNEATLFRDTVVHTVKTKKQECDARIKTLRTLISTMSNVKKSGTPVQRFIVENQLKAETNTLIKVVKEEMKNLQRSAFTCSFDSQFLNFRNRVNAERKACELNVTYFLAPISIFKLDQVAAVDLMNVEDINTAKINDGGQCYAGLDFLSDGRLVLLDKKNGRCLVYSDALVYLRSKKLPYDHPSGIVVVTDDEIIITTGDNKKLVFVKINKSNEIEITGYCSVKEECLSISVREEGGFLVSVVNSDQPVKFLSKDGSVCVDLELPKNVCRHNAEGNSTFVSDYDKAVWTDASDDALYIYDIASCTLVSVNDKKIVQPLGVTIGPSYHILVCCENAIVELFLTGQILSYHKLSMSRPHQICVNKDKSKLAVTGYENGNYRLLLYEIIA